MSRTYRKNSYEFSFRSMRYKNQRTETLYWIQEVEEYGFNARVRDRKLTAWGYINPWNDDYTSACREMDYNIDNLEELAEMQIDAELEIIGSVHKWKRSRMIHNRIWELQKEMRQQKVKKLKAISKRKSGKICW